MLDYSEVCGDVCNPVEQPRSGLPVAAVATQDKPNTWSVADGVSAERKQKQTVIVCLVPECGRDLSSCPYYLRRHRVCETHMKAKTVTVNGEVCRFCQQCGRFQLLTDFNGDRKSCDAALKAHSARRRQMNQDLTVLVNDRRSRGSRRNLQLDEEPAQGSESGARVSRRLACRRTKSAKIAAYSDPQQQQQRRSAAAAHREPRSDGDQAASSRSSKLPSGSMQSCDEPACQQQQGATFPPFLAFPQIDAGTTSPGQHSGSSSAAAAVGTGTRPAQRALSGSSDESGVQAQPQAGRYNLEGGAAAAAAGRSRLGMLASGAGIQADANMMQQQLVGAGYHPALCAGMDSSTRSSCAGQQQSSLAGWMPQHRTQDMQHQLQQMWSAAAVRAGLAGCSTGPQSAAVPLDPVLNPTLQPVQQQQQHLTERAFTGSSAGAAGPSGMLLSQSGMQQQQQPSLLQSYSSHHHQQVLHERPGWPAGAPAGQQSECGPDIWGLASTARVPQQLLQEMMLQQQQLGMSCQQQQQQLGSGVQQQQQQQQGGVLRQAEPGSMQQQQQQQQQSLVAMLLDTEMNAHHVPPAETEATAKAVPVLAAAAAPDTRAEGLSGACPDAAAAAAAGGTTSKNTTLEVTQHPLDNTLDEALDLLEVILAQDPEWQLVQSGSAATTNAPTIRMRTSSSPASNSGPLPDPCKRLSDVSWADLGQFGDAAAAAAGGSGGGGGDRAVGYNEGVVAGASTDVLQLPAVHPATEGAVAVALQAAPVQGAGGAVGAGWLPLSGAMPCMAGPSMQPLHAVHPVQTTDPLGLMSLPDLALSGHCTAGLAVPCSTVAMSGVLDRVTPEVMGSTPDGTNAQVLGPAVSLHQDCTQHQPQQVLLAGDVLNSSMGWVGEVGHAPSVPSGSEAVQGAGVLPGMPLLPEHQQEQQEAPLLSADCSMAMLQQQRLLAQQQLQQQQMLQELHRQQRQQLLQQHSQMQHYLVRLSIKLHGVMPDQLPSSTVQAMERLVVQNAGLMDAIMLKPSFRRGCVQMEFDLLVKPVDPMPAQQLQESGGKAAGKGRDTAQGAAGAAATSVKQAGWRPAQDWSDIAEALSNCPMRRAAEAQLREALPFQLLLEALLALPLLSSSGRGSTGSDSSSSGAAAAAAAAVLEDDTVSTAGSSSSSSGGLSCGSDEVYSDDIGSSSSSQLSLTVSDASNRTIGCAVRAVYAQIGGCLGMWTAEQGLVQDWIPLANSLVSSSNSTSTVAAAAADCVARPQVISAGPLCTAVSSSGDWSAGVGGLQPLVLQAVLNKGCNSNSSSSEHQDDTVSYFDNSSAANMVAACASRQEEGVQLWCTSGGSFVPLTTRPAGSDAAAAAAAAYLLSAAADADGGPVELDVLLGLPESQLPGMLLLQAERLSDPQYACSSNGQKGGELAKQQKRQPAQRDPLPLMSPLVPVVVCSSAHMAAEVSHVLLGSTVGPAAATSRFGQQQQQQHGGTLSDRLASSGTVSAADAASLLQQLGLLMDYWVTWQQQQQLGGTLSDQQQWAQQLLANQRYLGVIRSACRFWLMFAATSGMSATASCLLNIWGSVSCSTSSSSDAAAAATGPDVSAAATNADRPVGVTELPSSAAEGARALGAAALAAAPVEDAPLSYPEAAAAAVAAARPHAPAGLAPVDQWVFEDVTCGSSNSSSITVCAAAAGSSTSPTHNVSTQTPCGPRIARQQQSTASLTLYVVAVLVVVAAVVAARRAGWLPHALHVLHALSMPLGIITAGAVLSLIVLWQQQEYAEDSDFQPSTGASGKLGADMPDYSEVYAKQSVRTQGAAGADFSA